MDEATGSPKALLKDLVHIVFSASHCYLAKHSPQKDEGGEI